MGEKSMPQITIFTPTYNRAYCLHKCYESMKRQKNKNFIWLIIDDGSTDNTEVLVKQWKQNDNGFEIKYKFGNSIYNINVKNPEGKNTGVSKVFVNGVEHENKIILNGSGKVFNVDIIM